jgi:hypothetical protein
MKDKILKLVTRGDYYLKDAKSKFWMDREEEQGIASIHCSKAIKKYLMAYDYYLKPEENPVDNFHDLFKIILEKDPDFQKFYDKVYEVKCFAKQSKSKGEEFFMLDDEMDKTIKIALGIREYIANKIHFEKQFLAEYLGTSFMAI